MQTFLPYADFAKTARCLDLKRLGNQRNETTVILRACIEGTSSGWGRHPAVTMWRGYEVVLLSYAEAILAEWTNCRGRNNAVDYGWARKRLGNLEKRDPPWLGRESFHAAHRSNLLRKDPELYRPFGWTEPDDLPYEWK